MSAQKTNYSELTQYIPQNGNEENYALLTHYLLMRAGKAKTAKKKELIQQFGFDDEKLNSAEELYRNKHILFVAQRSPTFTFIDLFAGIGGFRLAMQANGGECVFSSEWDNAAKQTYYENYGEVPFGDITKPEIKAMIPEHFDVLCAGFPCQAFSIAGYRKGFDDVRGTLFFDVADILEKHHPKAFYLENVKNLKTHDIIADCEKMRSMDYPAGRNGIGGFYKLFSLGEEIKNHKLIDVKMLKREYGRSEDNYKPLFIKY